MRALRRPLYPAVDALWSARSSRPTRCRCRICIRFGPPDSRNTSPAGEYPDVEAVEPAIPKTTGRQSKPAVWAPTIPQNASECLCRPLAKVREYRLSFLWPSVDRLRLWFPLHYPLPIFQHRPESLFKRPQRLPTGVLAKFICAAKDNVLIRGPHKVGSGPDFCLNAREPYRSQ